MKGDKSADMVDYAVRFGTFHRTNHLNKKNRMMGASNNSEKLQFLQHAKAIFAEIDAAKEERCKSIESALKDTENF